MSNNSIYGEANLSEANLSQLSQASDFSNPVNIAVFIVLLLIACTFALITLKPNTFENMLPLRSFAQTRQPVNKPKTTHI